jgi:hypothetical protein
VGGVLNQPVQQVEGLRRQGLGGLVRLLSLIYAGPGDRRVNSIFGQGTTGRPMVRHTVSPKNLMENAGIE